MLITVTVLPRSSRNVVLKQSDGSYKVKLTAAPVDGAANKKLIELLADEFGVSKSLVTIVRGETGRRKVVEIG